MHQALQGATFHVEHVVPRAAGGSDDEANLALACPGCNLKKSDRVSATDPDSGTEVSLFHPRYDHRDDHFAWDGFIVTGRTATGRATVTAFDLNHTRRLLIRKAEEHFGLFPPG